MNFTENQVQAIQNTDGPHLIIAGPGSGKTAVLVEKILYLIKKADIDVENILAITFTNKAADEIMERVKLKFEFLENLPKICTFHNLAYQILKENYKIVGLDQNFQIALQKNKILSKSQNDISFDELIIKAVEVLEKNLKVLGKYQEKYKYIMVDEFQDTSDMEAKLINLIAKKHKNISVVGDSDQAIYGFKGANLENFLKFKETYPEAEEIFLNENFRSTQTIVNASQKLIENNKKRFLKKANTKNKMGLPINLNYLENSFCEAKFIIENIEKLIGGSANIHIYKNTVNIDDLQNNYSFKDIAVVYRLKAIGKFLKKYFEEASIPYEIIGDESFFEKEEILKVLEILAKIDSNEDLVKLENLKKICNKLRLSKQIEKIIEICDLKAIYDREENFQTRTNKFDNILQLQNMAVAFDELDPATARKRFLEKAQLSKNENFVDLKSEKIKLMTVHCAKGLEFPIIFIVAMEEGIFPFVKKKALSSLNFLEEERRLMYVAMTRAKERLFITYSKERGLYGKKNKSKPSKFISEIPEKFINFQEIRNKRVLKQREKDRQGTLF
ncbi:MAG: hypothetical protein UR28_C0004G0003 [Candidatus Peregrinibacteria bacterium GW2011_GWF2_33_10]|nr:MAG: hypothetical protein UR28_C0004G0003 [Candidatus Peregrinibacteria bacterium GW2011_GWF2_33_10]OGJ44134.1 MAG: hypothetical protein A2263_01795 [Candidatus Peregrinibacteria bacterium RIFOXYA2_FULL_33_21]OGJ47471.1 MAG: hypothetical protein A2272_06040 [Candidatus Peregrinibacteria bacterium RIFOXYA12_FULL_33_12]OGJ49972.1 MAG: hypothetical protein A2307_03775 [Candidatus Peregrinibacteria bacterium RIFOXYB2_FULL_33_20]